MFSGIPNFSNRSNPNFNSANSQNEAIQRNLDGEEVSSEAGASDNAFPTNILYSEHQPPNDASELQAFLNGICEDGNPQVISEINEAMLQMLQAFSEAIYGGTDPLGLNKINEAIQRNLDGEEVSSEAGASDNAFPTNILYSEHQPPKNISELQAFFNGICEGADPLVLNKINQRIRPQLLKAIELDKLLAKQSSLADMKEAGLLSYISQSELENIPQEHINYLTSAPTISEIGGIESKGMQFNLSAFLKVRTDLLKSGIIGALNEFDKDNLAGLAKEDLSKVCDFLSSLCPKLAQASTDYSEPMLKAKLEELKQLGLSDKNLDAIRHLVPMVQCGICANRIIENFIDPHDVGNAATPLFYSVSKHKRFKELNYTHVQLEIDILVAAGADLNQRNPGTGYTPLHSRNLDWEPKIAEILIDKGADPNIPNFYDEAPLTRFARAELSRTDIISLLLDAGAEIDRQDINKGWTATHYAINDYKEQILTLLLDAGADIDTLRTSDGRTGREINLNTSLGQRIYDLISIKRPLMPQGNHRLLPA